jgi:C-terminal processing protease CtpA/Prc
MKTRLTLIFGFTTLALTLLADLRQIGGIGIVIGDRKHDKEPLIVLQVYRGSPAERAGIKTNWFVISVNGTNVVSTPNMQCAALVYGPVSTSVTLELADPAMRQTNKFAIKRVRTEPDWGLPRSSLFVR